MLKYKLKTKVFADFENISTRVWKTSMKNERCLKTNLRKLVIWQDQKSIKDGKK